MKVLVTGSEGYIGKHLVQMLNKDTLYDVHTIDLLDFNSLNHVQVDVTNQNHIKRLDEYYDVIVHLAALVRVGESVKHPSIYYNTNVNGTYNILKNLECGNFIFASTGAASEPNSPYGFSKRVAEDIVGELADSYNIFRFYNVIGSDGFPPTNPDGLMSKLIDATKTGEFRIYGRDYNTADGTCMREYVHVNDICSAIIRSFDRPTNKIHNLAYGDAKSVSEIVDIFKEVNNVKFKIIFDRRREGDLEACYLRNASGFMQRNYSYEQMMRI